MITSPIIYFSYLHQLSNIPHASQACLARQCPPAIQEQTCHLSRVIQWLNPPLILTVLLCLGVTETVMTARVQMRLRLVTLSPVVNHCRLNHRKVSSYRKTHRVCFLPTHVQQRVRNARFGRDKMRLQYLDQQEDPFTQRDHTRDKIRHRVRKMLSDSPTEENALLIIKGKREICEPGPVVFIFT